jgi:hypothetical protein
MTLLAAISLEDMGNYVLAAQFEKPEKYLNSLAAK